MTNSAYMHYEQLRRFGFDQLAVVRISVCVGKSVYDMMQPQIDLRFGEHADRRIVSAGLHRLAAAVELASPRHAQWEVRTTVYNHEGRVYLELAADNDLEAEQGLECLRRVLEDDDGSLPLPGVI